MPERIETTTIGYECAGCAEVVEVDSPWTEDYPEGYYVAIRRVTEHLNHKLTPELYVCSKECFIRLVTYGINTYAEPVKPVLPPGTDWDRHRKAKKRSRG